MFCRKCGKHIDEGTLYCLNCGTMVMLPPGQQPPQQQPPQQPPPQPAQQQPTEQAAPQPPDQQPPEQPTPQQPVQQPPTGQPIQQPPMPPAGAPYQTPYQSAYQKPPRPPKPPKAKKPRKKMRKGVLFGIIGGAAAIVIAVVLLLVLGVFSGGFSDVFIAFNGGDTMNFALMYEQTDWDFTDITYEVDGEEYDADELEMDMFMDKPVSVTITYYDRDDVLAKQTETGFMVINTDIEDRVDMDDYRGATSLFIYDYEGEFDMDDLEKLPSLKTLYLDECDELEDFDDLDNLKGLNKLCLNYIYDINDIDALKKMPGLHTLVIAGCEIDDMDGLEDAKSLKTFALVDHELDLDLLGDISGLQNLFFGQVDIENADKLVDMNLQTLYMKDCSFIESADPQDVFDELKDKNVDVMEYSVDGYDIDIEDALASGDAAERDEPEEEAEETEAVEAVEMPATINAAMILPDLPVYMDMEEEVESALQAYPNIEMDFYFYEPFNFDACAANLADVLNGDYHFVAGTLHSDEVKTVLLAEAGSQHFVDMFNLEPVLDMCSINEDFKKCGELAGDYLSTMVDRGQSIVQLSAFDSIRNDMIEEGLSEYGIFDNYEILSSVEYDNEVSKSFLSTLLQSEDVGAVLCTDNIVAEAVAEVLEDYPNIKLVVIGWEDDNATAQAEAGVYNLLIYTDYDDVTQDFIDHLTDFAKGHVSNEPILVDPTVIVD